MESRKVFFVVHMDTKIDGLENVPPFNYGYFQSQISGVLYPQMNVWELYTWHRSTYSFFVFSIALSGFLRFFFMVFWLFGRGAFMAWLPLKFAISWQEAEARSWTICTLVKCQRRQAA